METQFTYRRLEKVLNLEQTKSAILKAESEGRIPEARREPIGQSGRTQRVWDIADVPAIGEKYGFFKKLPEPKTVVVYTGKGGALKSTITLNLARVASLISNTKTIVVGVDFQADISNALGLDISDDSMDDLSEIDEKINRVMGLFHLYSNESVQLEDIIQNTDIPTLDFIPETAELQLLEGSLHNEVKREDWLNNNVIKPLRKMGYELIIIDCPPSHNLMVTNALASLREQDLLVSPLEAKIAHYRSHESQIKSLHKFKEKFEDFKECYIPTKYSGSKKLSNQIKRHYMNNVENCTTVGIKESIASEEAFASYASLQEYKPNSVNGEEMRELLIEINERFLQNKESLH